MVALLRSHDIRRGFASESSASNEKVNLEASARWLGHGKGSLENGVTAAYVGDTAFDFIRKRSSINLLFIKIKI